MYSSEVLAKMMDYCFMRPHATRHEVIEACQRAKEYHFASFCILPSWVELACRQLDQSDVKVSTVIGFPFGSNLTSVKVQEARQAIMQGADEIDMVINIGSLRSGDLESVQRDIEEVVNVSQVAGLTQDGEEILTKVIIETCYLSRKEKLEACKLVKAAHADFVKTSTGFAPSHATTADIRLLREAVGSEVGIKASGAIRSLEEVIALLDAGSNRVESPLAPEIIDAAKAKAHSQHNSRSGRHSSKAEE